mmetsp:Transcript_12971/g.38107  ORF Transcript_12971/g.38107 Transcript_12971/m.38107 type:complete len:324 (-) Transcript_12971:294-1265(-)
MRAAASRCALRASSTGASICIGPKNSPRLFSTFKPPSPNSYHGTPVFGDIDMSSPLNEDAPSFARNADPDAVFVVTGASRGMGLQFVKSILSRTAGKVVAACRDPEGAAPALSSIGEEGRINAMRLDVTDQDQVDEASAEIEARYGRVDGLFNVAGVLGDGASTPGPERNLSKLDKEWLRNQMEVNAIGPMMLTKALAPLMRSKKGRKASRAQTVVVNMSARVASIADNTGPLGWHSYRMSKAALNQGTRTIAHELKRQGTWSVALYPGFTDTDMSKPFQKGVKESMIFPVDFTAERMLELVDRMEDQHSGGFYDWAGQALPF